MLDANDTEHFNLKGILINDPAFNEDDVLFQGMLPRFPSHEKLRKPKRRLCLMMGNLPETAPAVAHFNAYANIFNLNATFTSSINARADSCGYTSWLERALRYPPQGHIPSAPSSSVPGCDVYTDIVNAALLVNPCFNVDHLTDFCPYLWDILGFPSLGAGPDDYFARADVQKAINAPRTPDWAVCGNPTLGLNFQDHSPPAGLPSGPLAAVIERTRNVVVAHGCLDYLLLINGTLATIQNLTWHGRQGFHVAPSSWEEFYVPYGRNLAYAIDALTHQSVPEKPLGLVGGAGIMGRTHSERGLTFVEVWNSGHELAQYNPAAAFRLLEFLLGRVERLDVKGGGFSTEREAR
jgi:carboxypeptidase D